MRRGNERLEMLKSGGGVPREGIVGPVAGKKIAGDDTQMSLLTGRVASASDVPEAAAHDTTMEAHACDCCESAALGKVTNVPFGVLSNYKVPSLVHKKVKAEGSVPSVLVLRPRSAAIAKEPEPVREPLSKLLAEEEEQPLRPAPVEVLPVRQKVAVVPTPRKTRVRTPKPEKEEAAPAPAPKPLKVIRRRREETPKVFETIAKSFPKAMLEGVDIELKENNHRQID